MHSKHFSHYFIPEIQLISWASQTSNDREHDWLTESPNCWAPKSTTMFAQRPRHHLVTPPSPTLMLWSTEEWAWWDTKARLLLGPWGPSDGRLWLEDTPPPPPQWIFFRLHRPWRTPHSIFLSSHFTWGQPHLASSPFLSQVLPLIKSLPINSAYVWVSRERHQKLSRYTRN